MICILSGCHSRGFNPHVFVADMPGGKSKGFLSKHRKDVNLQTATLEIIRSAWLAFRLVGCLTTQAT